MDYFLYFLAKRLMYFSGNTISPAISPVILWISSLSLAFTKLIQEFFELIFVGGAKHALVKVRAYFVAVSLV